MIPDTDPATRRSLLKIGALVPVLAVTGSENAAGRTQSFSDREKTIMGEDRYDGIRFEYAVVDGVRVHYREAGDSTRPALVLLHGFPSTSRMWDRLIPSLAPHYRVIAPDYPGFGLSDVPTPAQYDYSFPSLARTTMALLRQIGISRYSLIMQDYGGPVGFYMATSTTEAVDVIVAQNMAAYDEALGPLWDARKAFWADPASHTRALQENFLSLEAARQRHVGASPNTQLYDPNSWLDEYAMLSRPGMSEVQTALFYDYRNNVKAYPQWQAWLRRVQPPMLVVWGRYDLSFMQQGALGFAKDNPKAETHLIDAGHFPLDEAPDEVRALTLNFLHRHLS